MSENEDDLRPVLRGAHRHGWSGVLPTEADRYGYEIVKLIAERRGASTS